MTEETANDAQVAQDNEIAPNNEAIQGDELVQGEELAQGDELVQGEELHGEQLSQGDDLVQGNELVVSEVITPPTTGTRRRRKKSLVWEHFTIEAVAGGTTRALLQALQANTLGSCPKIKNQEQRLALPSTGGTGIDGEGTIERPAKRRYRYTGYANAAFDQDRSCSYLAKMIIQHDYPLHIVQQPAFSIFIESLQPRFKIVDVDTMEGEVYAVYQKEKENQLQSFSTTPGRISLTIGLWTTSQTLGYVSLAGQFIDSEWKVHRRMLNFVMVSSTHSENALSEAISLGLSDWNMKDKLFTITLDNECSSHDIYSANLRDHLSNKNNLMLKGQLFVVRCYAHILNAVAQDVIASIHGVVYSIR
jgi:hypothetical protein